jgi:hypothetical protein
VNIFVLDENTSMAAQYHTDKHVVKMILEGAQMLSSVVRKTGVDAGYKLTHKNHPCTLWAGQSLSNWRWLRDLTYELHNEWKFRFGHNKSHKSILMLDNLPEPAIIDTGLTKFALAMPDECKSPDVVESYQRYYREHKSHLFKWTKRKVPYFVV